MTTVWSSIQFMHFANSQQTKTDKNCTTAWDVHAAWVTSWIYFLWQTNKQKHCDQNSHDLHQILHYTLNVYRLHRMGFTRQPDIN